MVPEEKGRQQEHHRDGPGVHQTCINVNHCSKNGSKTENKFGFLGDISHGQNAHLDKKGTYPTSVPPHLGPVLVPLPKRSEKLQAVPTESSKAVRSVAVKETHKPNSLGTSGLSRHADSRLLTLFLLKILLGLWPQVNSSGACLGSLMFSFSKETLQWGKKRESNKITYVTWEIHRVLFPFRSPFWRKENSK